MALVGILGGVGPAAGILLHQTLLQHTESNGVDQGHLNVCHFSRSADIASRVDFLNAYTKQQRQQQRKAARQSVTPATTSSESSSNSSDDDDINDRDVFCANDKSDGNDDDATDVLVDVENPANGMARTFALLRKLDAPVVAAIPCITFHAKPIWNEFVRQIRTDDKRLAPHAKDQVRYINMLDETVRFMAQVAPHCRRIGVLSTIGTRDARVFHDLLEPFGFTIIEVDAQTQLEVQDTIQNPQWGIKSSAPAVQPRCVTNFHRFARELVARGAELIILGCTEIPFAFSGTSSFEGVPLLDPLVALARALIREVDPLRLKPLA